MPVPRALSWRRKLFWGLLCTFVALGIPEIVLRLCLFRIRIPAPATVYAWPAADAQMNDLGFFLQPDEHCFYDLRPGVRYSYRNTPMDVINSAGLRGPDISPTKATAIRIACFGDSSTFGMCVSDQLTWVRQLEGLLRERHTGGNIETLNAGVVGYTVLQGKHKYESKVRPFHPAIALLAFGAINEKMPALGSSDLERDATWERDYRWHVRRVADCIWNLRTVQFAGRSLLELRARQRNQLIVQCQLGQANFEAGRAYQCRMSDDEFRETLTQFVMELKQDQCIPVLVNPHRRGSTEARYPQVLALSQAIFAVAETENIEVFDCNELFKRNPDYEREYFADTHHPNANGNRVIAEGAAQFLDSLIRELRHH